MGLQTNQDLTHPSDTRSVEPHGHVAVSVQGASGTPCPCLRSSSSGAWWDAPPRHLINHFSLSTPRSCLQLRKLCDCTCRWCFSPLRPSTTQL